MSRTTFLYTTAFPTYRRSVWCLRFHASHPRCFPFCSQRRVASTAAAVHDTHIEDDASHRVPPVAPAPHSHRTPLTKEQRQFLDSAVGHLDANLVRNADNPLAPGEPSRRACGRTYIHCSNSPCRPITPPPQNPNEAHVRSRSRALPSVQRIDCKAPHPSHDHVSYMARRGDGAWLVDGGNGPRGSYGVYRSSRDGDRRAL